MCLGCLGILINMHTRRCELGSWLVELVMVVVELVTVQEEVVD